MGNQQGSCISFPSPKQRCKTQCSPRTVTTDRTVSVTDNKGDNSSTAELPTLVCAKLCTEAQPMQFQSGKQGVDAMVFCTVEKRVTCLQKPGGQDQAKYACNSAKTIKYVGWQRHADAAIMASQSHFNTKQTFYMANTTHAQRLRTF